jgi:acyl transferase domain-containing protein
VQAIRSVLEEQGADQQIALSSVKAGLGHQEAAAGVAGLLKASISVKEKRVGPQAWLDTINPELKLDETNLKIAQGAPLNIGRPNCPVLAAVNSFGYGGTNAHVMVANHA